MDLTDVRQSANHRKSRKRVGRGVGSGCGKTSGRGHKGCGARAGGGARPLREGGQTPIYRRLPKVGFSNVRFAKRFVVVNVGDLSGFEANTEITPELLQKVGLVGKILGGVKILGTGELEVALKISAHKFSETAMKKIRDAGGEVKEL